MPTDVKVAQAIGTIGCALAASGIATLSTFSIPNLILPSRQTGKTATYDKKPGTPAPHLTNQWLDLYDRGKKFFPGLAGFSSLANLYVSWKVRDSPLPGPFGLTWSKCYLLAIASTMGIVPFTVLVMSNTNNTLKAHATRDDAANEGLRPHEMENRERDDEEVVGVLGYWAKLNLARSLFPLVGAGIGFYAAVSSVILP